MDICVGILLASFLIIGIVSLFTGIVSYIDDAGVFHNGPLYITNYIVPLILLIFILITAIDRKNHYTKDQFKAIIFFIVLIVAGVAIEFLLHYDTLTIMFGVSLALLIIQLSLETPDYKKMNDTMEALDLTTKNKYDIIFMDHMMPEMDGVEAFRKIREQKDGLNITTQQELISTLIKWT